MSLKETYIQYGVPSNWAEDYENKKISSATFKATTQKNLVEKYGIPLDQAAFVEKCLVRQPIDKDVVQKLLENNRFVCCLCKGQKGNAFIIHHIIEYSQTKDNSYKNLAVLCPNDHNEAHKVGFSLTNKITAEQIYASKINWEKLVKEENKKTAVGKIPKKVIKHWKESNPYKELKSYSENDKENFFGRKKEIEELLIRIKKYNIVGLFGESGTGKTSLINAGLIPNFKDDSFITISVRCLDEPIKRIKEFLIKELRENKITNELIDELSVIDTFPRLIIKLRSIVAQENKSLIIVVDQFEELFTRAREAEREYLAKGIIESLAISTSTENNIYFLLSLREDYIGELWDWAHLYNLEDAWIHQYRIKRLDEKKAFEAITEPLYKLGIKTNNDFVSEVVTELKNIGNGLIYPPYLQIVCSELFEEYKNQSPDLTPLIPFGPNLYKGTDSAESIIADYLSESMLVGLTEEEKAHAKNILDLLTGPEGLRSFLDVEEIGRYLGITTDNSQHVIEHLIKKKIVHPVVEDDKVIGYELVHDFLSKKFFEKLGSEAKKSKTTIDIFRRAYREWKQHGVLASRDRLEILFPNIKQLSLTYDEWTFLIKSSFSVYWQYENRWTSLVTHENLLNISLALIKDKEEKIAVNAIESLGKCKDEKVVDVLIELIESPEFSTTAKNAAISQFSYNIVNEKVMEVLRNIIKRSISPKLKKTAVYAFGRNVNALLKVDDKIVDKEIGILFIALNDSMTQVRKEAADVLSYLMLSKKSVTPLIERLRVEISIQSRKAIVSALGSLAKRGVGPKVIRPVLKKVSINEIEDYRVREEAKNILNTLDFEALRP